MNTECLSVFSACCLLSTCAFNTFEYTIKLLIRNDLLFIFQIAIHKVSKEECYGLPRFNCHKSPKRQPLIPPYIMRRGRRPSISTYDTHECDSLAGGGCPWVSGNSHAKALELALSSKLYKSFRYLQIILKQLKSTIATDFIKRYFTW